MNRAFFSGRLFGPVEVRYTRENVACASFNLSICDRYRKNNEWHTQYSSIPLEAWGKQAELLVGLDKGDEIFVECTARQDNWVDKNTGEKRYKLKFRIVQFGNVKKFDWGNQEDNHEPVDTEQQETVGVSDTESDIPF